MFSNFLNDAFFAPSGKYLFAVIRGLEPGVFLFGLTDGHWRFINELEGIPYQGVINRRLRHVFLTAQEITFVYNNRVRKYSLAEGLLVANQAQRNARELSYKGEDISHLFLKTR